MAYLYFDDDDNYWEDTTGADNQVYGYGGNDTLKGGTGKDTLNGGDGNDTLRGGYGVDYLYGDAGNDTLYGDGSTDYLYGGTGDDILYAGAGGLWDYLTGGAGNDILNGQAGVGWAYARYSDAPGGVTVDLRIAGRQNTGSAGFDTLINISGITGSNYNDHLIGNTGGNSLSGGGGNDLLEGNSGNDGLNGGDGDDILTGGAGDDSLSGGLGDNILDGGLGYDMVWYTSAATGVGIDLILTTPQNNGSGGTDVLKSIENIYGSQYNDHLVGNDSDNELRGEDGDDIIFGGAGNDHLLGDGLDAIGNDYLNGGSGDDDLWGGSGYDTYIGGTGNDTFEIVWGNTSTLDGGEGSDTLSCIYISNGITVDLHGTGPQEICPGKVETLLNIENIDGSKGGDNLIGNDANNNLSGNDGNDTLTGNLGSDRLSGSSGYDDFVYTGKFDSTSAALDLITDFQTGDRLVFEDMAGITVRTSAYAWKGSIMGTVNAIRADATVTNAAVFFTNGTDGFIIIKGKGRGQDFDNTLIQLAGRKTPLSVSDFLVLKTNDLIAPTVDGFTSSSASGTYREDGIINLTATMSEVVRAGSTFDVTLDTGDVVSLVAAADSQTLTGTYIVGAGDHSTDLRITGYSAGSVSDLAGNIMTDTALPEGNNLWDIRNIAVETSTPTLTGLSLVSNAGLDATYQAGDVIRVAATFNESVNVTGALSVKLGVGDNKIRLAKYIGGSGTNTLTFEYTVLATDADSNGVSIGTNALVLGTGGAISDSAGNNAELANLAVVDDSGHKVAGTLFLRISPSADSKGNFTVGLYNSDGTTARAQGDIRLTYAVSGGLTGNPPVLTIKDGQTSGQITITGATSTAQTVTLNNIVNSTGVKVDLEHNVGQYTPLVATSNNGPKFESVSVNNERTQVTMTFDQAVSKNSVNPGTIEFFNLTKNPDVAGIAVSSFNVSATQIVVNFATALDAGCEYEVRMNNDVLSDFSGLGVRDAQFITSGNTPDAIKSLLPVKVDQFPASATEYLQGYNTKYSHGIDGGVVSDSNAKFALDISEHDDVFSLFNGGTVKNITTGKSNGEIPLSYGNTVTVEYTVNGRKFYATYAHLESVAVNIDDTVNQGTVIGNAGNTGGPKGMGVHLHLQIGDSLNGTVASGNSQVAPTVYFQRFLDNETDGLPDGWTGKVRATDIFGTDATGSPIERLIGSNASERLFGLDGDDFLEGQGGHDELYGGAGADTIMGGMGNDLLKGGADSDTLDGGNDDDEMYGGNGKDTLKGGWGKDLMFGEEGVDSLEGEQGNDTLHGGDGADTLFGGDNEDILHGGLGAYDVMNGGGGKDTFYFEHPDEGDSINNPYNRNTIEDFKTGRDVIAFLDTNFGFGDLGDDTSLTDLQVNGETRFISAATIDECKSLRDSDIIDSAVFLYATTTGGLYFDRDGKDSTYAPVHIAKIGGDTLTEGDIIIVAQNIV